MEGSNGSKIALVAIAAVVIIGGGIFLATNNKDDKSATNTTNSSQTQQKPATEEMNSQNIVEVASSNPDFSTLVTAIKAAGLVETLSGEGPFTVFAPTNAAFDKLPAGTLDSLIADPAKLKAILTYHVVAGDVKAADVVKLTSAKTVNGGEVKIAVDGSNVKVNDASVTKTDIMTSNGTIHVIDTVLLPPTN
jgi:transforming growth factor-beta-induced protein